MLELQFETSEGPYGCVVIFSVLISAKTFQISKFAISLLLFYF